MDAVGKKVENQVQFWSLLGPFFVLLSIAVLLFKVSPHWYFPVSALIGIPLCVKWKMKGMAVALGCLFLLAGISYQSLELDDRYWHVGLSLAMAFSFIVLTLSLEEVQGLVNKLQLESQSRLDNFLLLDEKWKTAEQEWLFEKERSKSEIASLTQEAAKTQDDKQTFYKLAQLAKDELVQVREQHDQLLQDLLYKKQQIAQLHQRLEETELTIQDFVNSDSEKQIQTLTECLTNLEQEKEIFKVKITLTQEENQACQIEKEHLWHNLQACQEREKLCLMEQHRSHQDRKDQQNVVQVLQNKCLLMEQEKQAWLQAQTKIQQQYEQMRQLEAERLVSQEKQAKQCEEQYQAIQQQLQKQLEEEKLRAEVQLKQSQQQAMLQSQQEIKVLQERYCKLDEDLLGARQDLEAKNDALAQFQEKVEKLSCELCEQQSLIQRSAEQKQRLENLKSQLEQALQQTQAQLQRTKQKIDSNQQRYDKLPYASDNKRQIESMYIQLKEQFREKCGALDATRREFFHVNEELLKCKREYEEEHFFNQSANEYHLQRHILQLGRQFEQMQKLYQREIDDLTLLVGHLLRQMSGS